DYRKDVQGQSNRVGRVIVESNPLPEKPTKDQFRALAESLDRTRALAILMPKAGQLIYLHKELGLERRIREGLQVLIIGPPVPPATPDADWRDLTEKWLPATAAGVGPAHPDERLRVHRDLRLYFCLDSSRVCRFP